MAHIDASTNTLGATITSPANNSSAVSNQPIVITASASASDETIASVQFYDGSTLLGSGTGSGGVYTYSWSGAALGGHSLTVKVTDNSGDVQASGPIALTVVSDGGVYYIFPDQTDTPRVMTRATDNQMVWRWDQADPFGMATPTNPNGAFVSNLRFPGQLYDQEDNLNYNYFRNYDPTLGRYVQSDPIGLQGGINTYAYTMGNPVANSDLLGLCPNPKCQRPAIQPNITKVVGQMGRDLGINPLFIMATAVQEGGWDLPHVFGTNSSSNGQPLNNLFGMTHHGGDNIAYPSLDAAAQAWEQNWGQYLSNDPQTIQDYAADLLGDPKHNYNANPKYPAALADRYRQLLDIEKLCGLSF